MSLTEFWANIVTGARFRSSGAAVDSPVLDAVQYEEMLSKADLWLAPRLVEGYDECDFEFLPDDERKSLSECVRRFCDVARQVPATKPATEQQVQEARPQLEGILTVLRPDRYAGAEAFVLGKKIEGFLGHRLPEEIAELRFDTGEDSDGFPNLQIWVVLHDAAAQRDVFPENTREIRKLLLGAARRVVTERFPHVSFVTASEQLELSGTGPA